MFKPRLRGDLQAAQSDIAPPALIDPLTGLGLIFRAQWERDVVDLLDGTRTAAEIADVLLGSQEQGATTRSPASEGQPPPSRNAILALLTTVRCMRLTDDADLQPLELVKLGRARPELLAAKLPLLASPGSRFECGSCGMCCKTFMLGPLTKPDIAQLEKLPLDETFPSLHDRRPIRMVVSPDQPEEAPRAFLNTRDDGRCVFLDDDQLCGLHKRFGADTKPGFCRTFPREVVLTGRGVFVSDMLACASYGRTAFRGPLLRDEVTDQAAFFRNEAAVGPLVHVAVPLGGGVSVPLDLAMPLEGFLKRVVEETEGSLAHALRVMHLACVAFRQTLQQSAELAASPDQIASAFVRAATPAALAAQLDSLPAPANPDAVHARLLTRFGELLDQELQHERPFQSKEVRAGYRQCRETLALAARLRGFETPDAAPPQSPGLLEGMRATTLDIEAPPHRARFRRFLVDLVMGRRVTLAPTMPLGLVAASILVSAITTGARREAALAGRTLVTVDDLDRAQLHAVTSLRLGSIRKDLLATEAAMLSRMALVTW
ncbi:MAG: YkgJ family cysteine cluster protein [Planctomycetota bacterium]